MFENSGQKLQRLAYIFFALCCMAGVICFFVFGSDWRYGWGLSFAFLIACVAGGWLTSLIIYAFGELVENSKTNRETNQEILQYLKNMEYHNMQRHEPASTLKPDEKVSVKAEKSDKETEKKYNAPIMTAGSNIWICPECGTKNCLQDNKCQQCAYHRCW